MAVALVAQVSAAQDWPQWRGPGRDGRTPVALGKGPWPPTLERVWRVSVGGGHSSPLVSGGRVFLHSRQGEDEVVWSFDLETGRPLWRRSYPAPYTMSRAARSHGKGPKATPVVHDARVCTFGISGILSCFETDSGDLIWRKEFEGQFSATSPLYGVAMSPVIADDMLIAHVGGHDAGALTAFDLSTGAVRWAWQGDGPAYASPIVSEVAGIRQLVTQSQNHVLGLAMADGRLLWKIPFTTAYDQNAVTPIVSGDRVIFSGLDNGVHAVRIVKQAGRWAAEKLWSNDSVSAYMSSPVLEGGRIFGLSHRRKGQLFCLDASSGALLWSSEGRQAENASLVLADGLLFVLTEKAELLVAEPSDERFVPLATYTVADSPTWAHSAVLEGRVLVKDVDSLALWRVP
jgi:outer membrane protein assembly factor BamB